MNSDDDYQFMMQDQDIKTMISENILMKNQRQDLIQQVQLLQQQKISDSKVNGKLFGNAKRLTNDFVKISKKVTQQNNEIQDYKSQLKNYKSQLKDCKSKLKDYESQLKDCQFQLQGYQIQLKDCQFQLNDYKSQLKEIQKLYLAQIDKQYTLRHQNYLLNEKLKELKQKYPIMVEEQNQNQQRRFQQAIQHHKKLKDSVSEFKQTQQKLNKKSQEFAKMQAQLKTLQEEKTTFQALCESLQTENHQVARQRSLIWKQNQNLSAKLLTLMELIQTAFEKKNSSELHLNEQKLIAIKS